MLGLDLQPIPLHANDMNLCIPGNLRHHLVVETRPLSEVRVSRGSVRSRRERGSLAARPFGGTGVVLLNVAWRIALLRDNSQPFSFAAGNVYLGALFDFRDDFIVRPRTTPNVDVPRSDIGTC